MSEMPIIINLMVPDHIVLTYVYLTVPDGAGSPEDTAIYNHIVL